MRGSRNVTRLALAAIVGATLAAGATLAVEAGASSTNPTYYACLHAGTLTQVGKTSPTCSVAGAKVISWDSTGPQGVPGVQGPPGVQGTPGATGATGPQGLSDAQYEAENAWADSVPVGPLTQSPTDVALSGLPPGKTLTITEATAVNAGGNSNCSLIGTLGGNPVNYPIPPEGNANFATFPWYVSTDSAQIQCTVATVPSQLTVSGYQSS